MPLQSDPSARAFPHEHPRPPSRRHSARLVGCSRHQLRRRQKPRRNRPWLREVPDSRTGGWRGGQGYRLDCRRQRSENEGQRLSATVRPTEFLLLCNDGIRHPASSRHTARKARLPRPGQLALGRRRGDRMMGWMAPLRHLSAKLLSDRISSEWEPSMAEVTTIGLDLAKHVVQVHGVDAEGATVLRKQLRRAQVLAFFSRLPPCLVGLEACATGHYWARELRALGHEVRLMPAQYVKAYIKRNKHDAADAEAICEAVGRPTMRFVPVKTADQQAAVLLHRGRERLVRQRTGLVNALRGHLAEFGVIAPQGLRNVGKLIAIVRDEGDARLPD